MVVIIKDYDDKKFFKKIERQLVKLLRSEAYTRFHIQESIVYQKYGTEAYTRFHIYFTWTKKEIEKTKATEIMKYILISITTWVN